MPPTIAKKIPAPRAAAAAGGALALFQAIRAERPEAFFFETAAGQGAKKQTSIIGIGPFEALRRRGGATERVAGDGKAVATGAPFLAGLEALATLAEGDGRSRPFAGGGLFGCIGFEWACELEPTVPAAPAAGPDALTAEVFFARNLVLFDHATGEADFRGELAGEVLARARGGAGRARPRLAAPGRARPGGGGAARAPRELHKKRLTASLGFEGYRERVASLQESIRAGDIFQAVLAERFECETEASAIDIFAQLYRINSAAYSFFFPFSQGEFMGASPEALLKVCQGRALTHPIAGTKPRGKTAIEDRALAKSLRASRKESAEHLMLVDLARNDLGRVAKPGSVRVNFYRSLQKLANVMHLVSEVEAELEPRQTPLRALASCFPAGTLSGAPKIRAMQLLAGLEREGRGLYGGAAIALDPLASRLESCIAIRCIEKRGRLAILRAGAGIVADSKARSEYDEISHKLLSARQALAAAERARARRSKA